MVAPGDSECHQGENYQRGNIIEALRDALATDLCGLLPASCPDYRDGERDEHQHEKPDPERVDLCFHGP